MTKTKLKQALAKMLPDVVFLNIADRLHWNSGSTITSSGIFHGREVFDTELLYLCRRVELSMSPEERKDYRMQLVDAFSDKSFGEIVCHASWQERIEALCKVKGIKL